MKPLCYLDGEILPLAAARIDPRDRGFLFGDAVYEVVKVLRGVPLLLDEHLRRLGAGLAAAAIPEPPDLAGACRRLLRDSGIGTGSLYLQVTRGVAPRTRIPPRDLRPTVVAFPSEHALDPPGDRPHRAVTVPDWRWRRCDIKTTSLMATVLGKLAAREAGADEVLFLGQEGELREGGSTNVLVRRGEVLETHPLGEAILPGVTRRVVLDLAAREGLEVRERSPRLGEREEWREVLVCGTLTGVQGVVEIDGAPVADGRVGPWTRRLAAAYAALEEGFAAKP